jgi:uncharacterized membrane protein YphA (DoxX/SURF4 family)
MKRVLLKFSVESTVRYTLGTVFLMSGLFKLGTPEKAIALIETLGVRNSSLAEIVILAMSMAEVVLGLLLIVNKKTQFASLSCVAFLLVSTVIGVLMLPRQLECGCFGEVLESKIDAFFLFRNLVLLLFSMFVFRYSTLHISIVPQ